MSSSPARRSGSESLSEKAPSEGNSHTTATSTSTPPPPNVTDDEKQQYHDSNESEADWALVLEVLRRYRDARSTRREEHLTWDAVSPSAFELLRRVVDDSALLSVAHRTLQPIAAHVRDQARIEYFPWPARVETATANARLQIRMPGSALHDRLQDDLKQELLRRIRDVLRTRVNEQVADDLHTTGQPNLPLFSPESSPDFQPSSQSSAPASPPCPSSASTGKARDCMDRQEEGSLVRKGQECEGEGEDNQEKSRQAEQTRSPDHNETENSSFSSTSSEESLPGKIWYRSPDVQISLDSDKQCYPRFVAEIGISSTMDEDQLQKYIRNTRGHVGCVLYVQVPYTSREARAAQPLDANTCTMSITLFVREAAENTHGYTIRKVLDAVSVDAEDKTSSLSFSLANMNSCWPGGSDAEVRIPFTALRRCLQNAIWSQNKADETEKGLRRKRTSERETAPETQGNAEKRQKRSLPARRAARDGD